jgi:methyl-accepting chemotaxis protein
MNPLLLPFRPIVLLLNLLPYAAKFGLIAVIVLVPFSVLAYLQSYETSKQIVFNQKEGFGQNYIHPLQDMLEHVQLSRAYAAGVFADEAAYRAKLLPNAKAVEEQIAKAQKWEEEYAVKLNTEDDGVTRKPDDKQTKPKWDEIKRKWQEVTNQLNSLSSGGSKLTAADLYDAHTKLADLVIAHIGRIGDNSNLILDPDLDSYWLMDSYVSRLALLCDYQGKAAARAADVLTRKEITAEERIELAALAYNIRDYAASIKGYILVTSLGDHRNHSERKNRLKETELTTACNEMADSASKFADFLTETLLKDKRGSAKPAEVLASFQLANDKAFALYNMIGPELQRLIQARVDDYSARRTTGYIVAGITAVVLAYVLVGFYTAVSASIGRLEEVTAGMISGSLSGQVVPESNDEVGKIALQYNKINDALVEARQLRAKVEAENAKLQENILDVLKVVANAADGDLTVRVPVTEGALGNVADALNEMFENFARIIGSLLEVSGRLEQAALDIRGGNEGMTSGAAKQVEEITRAAELVQRLSKSLAGVSQNADNAAGAARRAQEAAQAGSQGVQRVVDGMAALRADVQSSAKKVKGLGDRSMEITRIVAVIANISDQTNMLALNAAIEAARAGEQGRGFSVVAEEVRKLAERTALATQEIEKLVKDIQAEANQSVAAMEQETAVVERESRSVSDARDTLVRIEDVSVQSAKLIAEISEAAKRQVEGTAVVVKTMAQVSEIARSTQSGAGATLEITSKLAELSRRLNEIVGKFKAA